jgi:uncharacterized damage-inducible protein DinB
MESALLQRLFAHLGWSNSRTLPIVSADGVSTEITARFMHLLAAEHVWSCRLRGATPTVPLWAPFDPDLAARLMAANHAEFAALLASADNAALAREIFYTNSAGQSFRSRIDDILLHVAMHGQWHRGQIAMLVRQSGKEPVPGDYIAFVRGAPAAPKKA